jgi:3-oxoacyl-[acyl-carrier protein] reductase
MSIVKKVFYKICLIIKKTIRSFNFLRQVYRYGGYTTANIAYINHGAILKGKKILITGGSSGIGLSIARKCLNEGATVIITGRNDSKLKSIKASEGNESLKIMVWDVSIVRDMHEKLEEAETALGGEIDILINNAGIVNGVPFSNVTEEVWDKVYATNSKGLFFLTQTLCNKWIKNKSNITKKVINISSQGGFVGATYPYRMTKWDVAGLTQGLALKLIPHGIIVNGIAPGITATSALPFILEQKENIYSARTPSRRYALPEEMAELAIFLMSDAANFIVGQTIVCDGGYSIN